MFRYFKKDIEGGSAPAPKEKKASGDTGATKVLKTVRKDSHKVKQQLKQTDGELSQVQTSINELQQEIDSMTELGIASSEQGNQVEANKRMLANQAKILQFLETTVVSLEKKRTGLSAIEDLVNSLDNSVKEAITEAGGSPADLGEVEPAAIKVKGKGKEAIAERLALVEQLAEAKQSALDAELKAANRLAETGEENSKLAAEIEKLTEKLEELTETSSPAAAKVAVLEQQAAAREEEMTQLRIKLELADEAVNSRVAVLESQLEDAKTQAKEALAELKVAERAVVAAEEKSKSNISQEEFNTVKNSLGEAKSQATFFETQLEDVRTKSAKEISDLQDSVLSEKERLNRQAIADAKDNNAELTEVSTKLASVEALLADRTAALKAAQQEVVEANVQIRVGEISRKRADEAHKGLKEAKEKAVIAHAVVSKELEDLKQHHFVATSTLDKIQRGEDEKTVHFLREAEALLQQTTPFLGLSRLNDHGGTKDGIVIEEVLPGGPADSVGLRAGYKIVGVNNSPTVSGIGLQKALRAYGPGDIVTIQVLWPGAKSNSPPREVELKVHSRELDILDVSALKRMSQGNLSLPADSLLMDQIRDRLTNKLAKVKAARSSSPRRYAGSSGASARRSSPRRSKRETRETYNDSYDSQYQGQYGATGSPRKVAEMMARSTSQRRF